MYLPTFLSTSLQQAKELGRQDQQRLHRNRKLVLMVDLDQTLIHTTEQHCQQMSNKVSGPSSSSRRRFLGQGGWLGREPRAHAPRAVSPSWSPPGGAEARSHPPAPGPHVVP